jgi:hypothetical protein
LFSHKTEQRTTNNNTKEYEINDKQPATTMKLSINNSQIFQALFLKLAIASSQAIGGKETITHASFLGPTTLYCPDEFDCTFNEGCQITMEGEWIEMGGFGGRNLNITFDMCDLHCQLHWLHRAS